MAEINPVVAAFTFSSTPHVVLSPAFPYPVAGFNPAFGKLLKLKEDFIETEGYAAKDFLTSIFKLPEANIYKIFEEVKAAITPYTLRIEEVAASQNVINIHQPYIVESYPVVQEDAVLNIVLKLIPVSGEVPAGLNANTIEALSENQSLHLIFDSLADVIFVLEVESPGIYKFSFTNQAFQVTTGVPVDMVIGRYVHDVIPEPSLTLVREKYKEAIETGKQIFWEEVTNYPYGQKTAEVSVIPVFDENGNCLRLVGSVHDVTEYKEAEARQIRLKQDLYLHNRDLQQFTYIVSHNLRAPLANALGLAKHLPQIETGTPLFKEYGTRLINSPENLDQVLKDVNMILSLRDKDTIMETEPASIAQVCHQAHRDLAAELSACNGTIRIDIADQEVVTASKAYLYSIFFNLISNAIKYRSPDRLLEIGVSCYRTGENQVVVKFSDNGSGINMQKHGNNLFKLYKRFHPQVKGRGIGLFLVKTHVEALGGKIVVDSALNVGTTFTIHLNGLV